VTPVEPPSTVATPVPDASTTVAPLVVQATRPAVLKKQTYGFVEAFAATSETLDQVARWAQPVCVTVQGLPADAAAEVKGRVEEVANALKVGVSGAGCRPNIQIAFTKEPKAVIDEVAKDDEPMLGYRHRSERHRLTTISRPVQAWYVTGTGGPGGDVAGLVLAGVGGGVLNGYAYDDEDNSQERAGCGESRLSSCLASEFQHVLVIVDINRVQQYPAGLIGDYVTMLAMSQPKTLDGCDVLPSVVDLFSKGCSNFGMDGLTRADVAYLTALYKTDPEARKASQQADIARRMADMLIAARAADRRAVWGEMQKVSTGK
jgi:hypothetical protein